MADYNTLQDALDAGTRNMTASERTGSYTSWKRIYFTNNLNFVLGALRINEMSVGKDGDIDFVDKPNEANLKICYHLNWGSSIDYDYTESGKINGNEFFRYTNDGYPRYELFFFGTGQIFLKCYSTTASSNYTFRLTSQEQLLTYDGTKEDVTFTPADVRNGLDWSVSYEQPELPKPITPGPSTRPTIVYNFEDGKRYRVRVKTTYKNALCQESEIYSNYSDEFVGRKISNMYYFYEGGAIDLTDNSVWDDKYTNRQGVLYLEGDYKGLHYKHYKDSENLDLMTVITGKQTEIINSFNEFPFNDTSVNPSQQSPAYWGYRLYIDAEILNLTGWFIVTSNRFFSPPSEVVFGKHAVIPPLTGRLAGSPSDVYGGLFELDNLSQSDFIIDMDDTGRYEIFWDAYISAYSDRTKEFLKNIKFSNQVESLDYLFDGCNYLKGFDTSKYECANPVSIMSMFNGCRSFEGTIDLRKLVISDTMEEAFRSCRADEILIGSGVVTNMKYAFGSCINIKRLDLSGLSSGSSSYTIIQQAFYYCSSLEYLDISNLRINTSSSSYVNGVFTNCAKLKELHTPKASSYPSRQITLPITMYDNSGRSYTTMPTDGRVLYSTNPVG